MIYTLQEGQSFDAEILRQELCKALCSEDFIINTGGKQVEVRAHYGEPPEAELAMIEQTILAHFANGATREANKAILKQIADLEATQTPRRVREGGQWMVDLENQIAALRGQLL